MLDTRDLETRREELKDKVYSAFLDFVEENKIYTEEEIAEINSFDAISFDDVLKYEKIQEFIDAYADELKEIEQIDSIEDDISSFSYGVTLILEDEFVDYVEELCIDIGDIPKDLPDYIKYAIDWERVADAIRCDYREITYMDEVYLYRD